MTPPPDETEQFAPDPEPAPDTAQFPVTRATESSESEPAETRPQHAVSSGTEDAAGISRAGWWTITIAAAVLLILGFLLTFGPARYWTPVPVVFLGYFLISGVIGLVFWKGVRELRDSNPNLDTHEPASTGARVAAAVGAVGIASALVLLPAGLSSAPANALPCPDGSNTCGPTAPTFDPGPTQGSGQTAPQAPQTTIPGYTPPNMPTPPTQGTPNDGGNIHVQTPDFGTPGPNDCILNCGPTQAPQTGQANPPQTRQQNPVTTASNTPATTPQRPVTTTPKLRTPTPETTTSTTSSKARDTSEQRSSNENRDKNSPYPYQAAELAAVAGTYRRRKISESAVRSGRVVSENVTENVFRNNPIVGDPVAGGGTALRGTPKSMGRALYGPSGRPEPGDVANAQESDCWFNAAMIAVAHSNPQRIKDMITENPDGSFDVSGLRGGGQHVTRDDVDKVLGFNPGFSGPLWPVVIEAAEAKSVGYGEIAPMWGSMPYAGLQDLTNSGLSFHHTIDDAVTNAANTGVPVVMGTLKSATPLGLDPHRVGLVQSHAYAVTKVWTDPTTGHVMANVVNPWGYNLAQGESGAMISPSNTAIPGQIVLDVTTAQDVGAIAGFSIGNS